MHRTRKQERGVVAVGFALSMVAFFALAAVVLDGGRLAHTANQVQNLADIAATAGAKALLEGKATSVIRGQAQGVVAQNFVDGAGATIDSSAIELGQYDVRSGSFTNGATPPNAVRATPSATVQNLFVGIFGSSFASSTVTKRATAGVSGVGSAAPTLPLAIGDCNFPSVNSCFSDPSCLPSLSQAPSTTDNSGWTSFLTPNTSTGTISQYLPAACGGSQAPPVISVGTSVNLNNGQVNVLKNIQDCVNQGIKQFVIPIVSCSGNFNQSSVVTGFATIVVDSVQATGSPKGINLHAIFNAIDGPAGGGTFGTNTVRLFS